MSSKNSILFVTPYVYPCYMGGIEVFNYHLIDELKKYYSINVLTYCNDLKIKGVAVHKLKWRRFAKLNLALSILFFIIKNKNSIKLIYFGHSRSHWIYSLVFIIAKKLLSVKYGFTFHGGGLPNRKTKFPYKLLCKNAEFITGVSDRIVQENTKKSKRDIIYTPPLLPFDVISPKNIYRAKWKIDPTDVVLLYVGSLKPLKAVDSLIEALGVISIKRLQQHKLKVLIAGDGVSRKNLEKRVSELNLHDIVKFLGIVDRNSVNQLYNLANLYTICSEFEGLPISLLEAFANDLPCITSDATGLIDMSFNNKNSLLFKTRDFNDYANKLELLLNDIQLQDRLRKNAKIYYEKHFSYDILIRDFRKIIDKID